MNRRPPETPTRMLARALAGDEAGPTVLGDLHEAFIEQVERHGAFRAKVWYWREASLLALSTWFDRRFGSGRASRGAAAGSSKAPIAWVQDGRYALRSVRRELGFTLFTVLVIGIGVGASTAVFSVMSPLLLAPLPFDEPDRLVWIANSADGESLSSVTSRSGNLRDFRVENRTFEGITGYNAFFDQSSYSLTGGGSAEQVMGAGVAHDFLDVLGVDPLYGRGFTADEGVWAGPPVVILTHGFWTRRFAADPSLVGRTITLDETPYEVVGVLPPSFDFSSVFTPTTRVDVLVTFAVSAETDRWGNTMSMIGRLRPGASVEAAQADLESIIVGLEEAEPERWGLSAAVSPLQEHIAGPFKSSLYLLAGAAGALMLIVCVNLSNMLLARAPQRTREMALRRTLGATRGRLVRQLLIENLVRASGGAFVGLGLAVLATRMVASSSGIRIPMLDSVAVDGTALAFSALIAVAAGLLVGVVPALQVSEGGEAEALKASAVRTSTSRGGKRLREILVVSEVALACVLLVFGGLFLKSFQQVLDVELGFDPAERVAWQLNPSPDFESIEERAVYFDEVVRAVEAIPGVTAAGLIDALPLGKNRTWGARVPGQEELDQPDPSIFPHMADHRYLDVMGIDLVAGRWFTIDDNAESERVIVINETAAKALYPGQNAVGQTLLAGGNGGGRRVIGVVEDVKHLTLESGSGNQVYFPMRQMWDNDGMDLAVRTGLPSASLSASMASALSSVDPGMPTNQYWTLEETVAKASSARRFTLSLLGAFGSVAVLLAGLGIYGVLSYSVTERIPEIGIRMALGASAGDVRRDVVGRTMVLTAGGLVLGILGALVGTRLIASLLYGVEPTDPMTLIATVALLTAVAAISGYLPAHRAARTNSTIALKG